MLGFFSILLGQQFRVCPILHFKMCHTFNRCNQFITLMSHGVECYSLLFSFAEINSTSLINMASIVATSGSMLLYTLFMCLVGLTLGVPSWFLAFDLAEMITFNLQHGSRESSSVSFDMSLCFQINMEFKCFADLRILSLPTFQKARTVFVKKQHAWLTPQAADILAAGASFCLSFSLSSK